MTLSIIDGNPVAMGSEGQTSMVYASGANLPGDDRRCQPGPDFSL